MKNHLLLVPLLALLAGAIPAQDPGDDPLAGDWHGTLEAMGMKMRVVLHVVRDASGAYGGTFDSVDQGAMGLKLASVELKDGAVRFSLQDVPARYEGVLEPGEKPRIAGHWHQTGKIPLTFERGTVGLNRPQVPVAPLPYQVEAVAYGYEPVRGVDASFQPGPGEGEGRIAFGATLTLPEGDGPFSAALLISGSGPQDRDETVMGHKPFLILADHLTRAGFAVLRYDDRGTAESTGAFAGSTSEDFAEDARAGIRYLRTREEIDPERIGLIGHSEGGLIAPMVAAGPDADKIAFIILLAGPGVTGAVLLKRQRELIGRASGASDEDIADNEEVLERFEATVAAAKDEADLRARLDAMMDELWDELPMAARTQLGSRDGLKAQFQQLTTPWFRFFMEYDPAPALANVRCPVLALNGEKDLQVDPAQNLPAVQKALASNDDATCTQLAGLNHLFQPCETGAVQEYSKIELTMSPEALAAVSDWLKQRF